jgi:hypothetical protein
MSTPQEAVDARRELRRHLKRIDALAARCLSQVCDGDVRMVDRESAEKRLGMLLKEGCWTEKQLQRIGDALEP